MLEDVLLLCFDGIVDQFTLLCTCFGAAVLAIAPGCAAGARCRRFVVPLCVLNALLSVPRVLIEEFASHFVVSWLVDIAVQALIAVAFFCRISDSAAGVLVCAAHMIAVIRVFVVNAIDIKTYGILLGLMTQLALPFHSLLVKRILAVPYRLPAFCVEFFLSAVGIVGLICLFQSNRGVGVVADPLTINVVLSSAAPITGIFVIMISVFTYGSIDRHANRNNRDTDGALKAHAVVPEALEAKDIEEGLGGQVIGYPQLGEEQENLKGGSQCDARVEEEPALQRLLYSSLPVPSKEGTCRLSSILESSSLHLGDGKMLPSGASSVEVGIASDALHPSGDARKDVEEFAHSRGSFLVGSPTTTPSTAVDAAVDDANFVLHDSDLEVEQQRGWRQSTEEESPCLEDNVVSDEELAGHRVSFAGYRDDESTANPCLIGGSAVGSESDHFAEQLPSESVGEVSRFNRLWQLNTGSITKESRWHSHVVSPDNIWPCLEEDEGPFTDTKKATGLDEIKDFSADPWWRDGFNAAASSTEDRSLPRLSRNDGKDKPVKAVEESVPPLRIHYLDWHNKDNPVVGHKCNASELEAGGLPSFKKYCVDVPAGSRQARRWLAQHKASPSEVLEHMEGFLGNFGGSAAPSEICATLASSEAPDGQHVTAPMERQGPRGVQHDFTADSEGPADSANPGIFEVSRQAFVLRSEASISTPSGSIVAQNDSASFQ